MSELQENDREYSILKDFYQFLLNPQPIPVQHSFHWNAVFKSMYLYVVIFFLGILVITPLFSLIEIENIPHHLEDFIEQFSRWQALLIVVILAPFLEEFIFRFPIKYSGVSLVFLSIILSVGVFYFVDRLSSREWAVGFTIGFAIISSTLLIRLLAFGKNMVSPLFRKYYFLVFYLFAIVFSLAHIFNFESDFIQWYFIPIMVFPQFLLALVLGFLRLKYGMWANIFIHGFNNLWPMLMLFASDSFSVPGM